MEKDRTIDDWVGARSEVWSGLVHGDKIVQHATLAGDERIDSVGTAKTGGIVGASSYVAYCDRTIGIALG